MNGPKTKVAIIGSGNIGTDLMLKILRLSEDLPFVVEIVDSKEKIEEFLPVLDGMMGSGLVTMERIKVLQYGSPEPRQ